MNKVGEYFIYDKALQSYIAIHPEFGNEKGNDHHFHYGYYIRAAAIIGQDDPADLEKWEPFISEMVADIATTARDSKKYPYLRTFNPYESHSYADGFAIFGDGNDQESSSEAMNAWYGVYLWSLATKNTKQTELALSLFNSELLGTKYYWFNTNSIYPQGYSHSIASIVWGGKVDFATWFSGDTNMIYGIQILPLTPASIYLRDMDSEKYKQDFLSSGGSLNRSWADLFIAWQSFHNKAAALSSLSQLKYFDGSESKSLTSYFVYSQQ